MRQRAKQRTALAQPLKHVESKGRAAIGKTRPAKALPLDWSARVSLMSCLVSVVFGLTTVWQTIRHERQETVVAQAAARSVAVLYGSNFNLVNSYVFQTQLMFSSALHKTSFAEAVSSGSFEQALSVIGSPSIEMSREEMDIIGKAFPATEALVAQCKSALTGMNQSKVDGLSLVHSGPTSDDPDNSTAQVYLYYEIKLLPKISEICSGAAAALNSIAMPGEVRQSQSDKVQRRWLAETVKGEKFKLLDRPTGRYQFGPVLEKMSRGESVHDVFPP